MTNTTQSYHDTSVSDKPIVPNLPSDGTIYMFGHDRNLYKNLHECPSPDPTCYYTSKEQLLKHCLRIYDSQEEPKLVKKLSASEMCWVYKTYLNGYPIYIYVWAISPAAAGGAA